MKLAVPDLRIASRLLAAIGLSLLASAPAFGATYQIGLFQTTTGTGSGSFTFTNPGTPGSFPTSGNVTLATNASSSIGAQTFVPGPLNVEVTAVNFNDGKTPPNQITGNFVEGLTGSLATTPVAGLTPTGQCQIQVCFYRITFFFTANTNPNSALKSYKIDLVRQSTGNIVDTPVPATIGRYSVSNTATIPEPDSVALFAIGLAALSWVALARRRQTARNRGVSRR
jgi:hypothetical protein